MGIALRVAQNGGKSDDAKPMHGVLREVTEISTQDESGAYRLMYSTFSRRRASRESAPRKPI
jgi:phage-related protein